MLEVQETAVQVIATDLSIADAFRQVVASQPDAPALTSSRGTYTYADLDRWSDAIAADIAAQNAPSVVPVAIVTSDNIPLVPAAIAAVKAGHFFVMIDAADPDDRIALILRESGAVLCVVDSVEGAPLPARALSLVPIRALPAEPVPFASRPPNPLVHLVFTSGTTGKPKGVATRQQGFVTTTRANGARRGLMPGHRITYTALPGFTRATNSIFNTLLNGAVMCAFDARNESLTALAEYIRRERIDFLSLTPSMFRRLMSAIPPRDLDLSSVKKLRIGADVVTIADLETFRARFPRGCALERGFASTESGGVFQMSIHHDTPVPGPLVPMGPLRAGVEVRLIDDDGHDVPDGEAGELVVTSAEVADGYWNAPELTAQRFVFHPDRPGIRTFYTGDLVKRDAEGIYYFVGRKDARLKIHGRRIDPSEVEAALLATGDIREAVVVGKPDDRGEQRLVAYVVMRQGSECVPRAIRASLRASVPSWMVPARVVELDAIPMTRATKVDRAALIARIDPQRDEESGATDEIERQLVEIWTDVIGVPLHIDDDFFDDLGGESVIAAHLVTAIESGIGQTFPLSLIVELNTVRKMAAYFRTAGTEKPLSVVLQQGGALPPIFCIGGAGGGVVRFRELGPILGPDRPLYGLQPHGFDLDNFPATYAAVVASYTTAVRHLQPAGPYYFAGYSSGGRLAYELARHFEQEGERVAFVGVIDSVRVARALPKWRRLVNRVQIVLEQPSRALGIPREILKRTKLAVQWRIVRRNLERGKPLPGWLQQTRFAMRQASSAPADAPAAPYSGPVTLFRARLGLRRIRHEQDLGWTAFAPGGLRIVDVEGDHDTVLGSDIASLGRAMAEVLATLE